MNFECIKRCARIFLVVVPLVLIYQNCPERVATYSRWRWIATAIAWMLIFVAFLLSTSKMHL